MPTSRYMLKTGELENFRTFCEAYGWEFEHTVAPYEVLRMSRKGSPTLIVHRRTYDPEFLTVHGSSYEFAKLFTRSKRR